MEPATSNPVSAPAQPLEHTVNPTETSRSSVIMNEKNENVPLEQIGSQSEPKYPQGAALAIVMLGVYLATFLVAIDRTIIATAIPRITDDFSSLGDVGWYGSSYLLTTCAFQILFGRLYTFYSPKVIFLTAIVIFEIGSAICGAAPTSTVFIVGRAIAGLGSAGIFAGNVVIIINSIPLAKRPVYIASNAGVFGVSCVVAPVLGGAFADKVSWRWCFYINLPVGAVTLVSIFLMLKISVAPAKAGLSLKDKFLQLDPLGNLLFMPANVCLILALQWGGSVYPWSNGRVIALLVVFAVLTVAYIIVQWRMQSTASIPGRIIKQRSIAAGLFITTCGAAVMNVMIYYLPIWFQAIKGASAVKSGVMNIPLVLSLVIASIIAGIVTKNVGYYMPALVAASIILPIGAGLFQTFTPTTAHPAWIGYQVLLGLGLGLSMQQPSMAAQTVLAKQDVPTGIALVFFVQSLSGAIFISVAQNVFAQDLVRGLKAFPAIDARRIVDTGATELRNVVGAEQLGAVVSVYNHALLKVFTVAVALASAMVIGVVFMEWKNIKEVDKKKEEPKV